MRILTALRDLPCVEAALARSGRLLLEPARSEGAGRATIRLAGFDDLDQLRILLIESGRELRAMGDPAALQQDLTRFRVIDAYLRHLIAGQDSGVMVAEVGSRLVGMMGFMGSTQPEIFKTRKVASLVTLYVRPRYRKLRLAARISENTIDWLDRCGVEEIQLAYLPTNVASARIWEKLGFKMRMNWGHRVVREPPSNFRYRQQEACGGGQED